MFDAIVSLTMKFVRIITLMLILMIAFGPALASNCASSCASHNVMKLMKSQTMAKMAHCHEAKNTHSDSSNQHNNMDTTHQTCTMGAGCNFSQVLPVVADVKYSSLIISDIAFSKLTPLEKSVDLSPPLKPPA